MNHLDEDYLEGIFNFRRKNIISVFDNIGEIGDWDNLKT